MPRRTGAGAGLPAQRILLSLSLNVRPHLSNSMKSRHAIRSGVPEKIRPYVNRASSLRQTDLLRSATLVRLSLPQISLSLSDAGKGGGRGRWRVVVHHDGDLGALDDDVLALCAPAPREGDRVAPERGLAASGVDNLVPRGVLLDLIGTAAHGARHSPPAAQQTDLHPSERRPLGCNGKGGVLAF